MEPTTALAALAEDCDVENISHCWELSAAAQDEVPDFLTPKQILKAREWCGFTGEFDTELIETARLIAQKPALRRLARHCKWLLFDGEESCELKGWPTFVNVLGDRCGLFYLLVGLGMVPHIRACHRSLGIPEQITRSTCLQVRCFCETHQQGHGGRPGIQLRRISWLRHYVREPIFRVGRLEFWLKPNPCYPTVFRNCTSGQVLALAWDGETFTRDGYIEPECTDPARLWRSTLTLQSDGVTGHPISPYGMALRRQITLPFSKWKQVLAREDPVLQVHIPAGGKMTPEAVKDSLNRAVTFFERYFPQTSPRAFVSTSWAFSNLLENQLPPTSNTVRFLRELYLFPIPSNAYSGLSFIFPEDTFDPSSASRETFLQRAILDFILTGNRWHIGGMFMLLQDLKHFGSQHYRSTWPPAELQGAVGDAGKGII